MHMLQVILRATFNRDALHTYFAFGSVCGIGYGIALVHLPAAIVVVSGIVLAGVIYARVKG